MPPTKDLSQVAKKWARVTPGRAEDYLNGVQNPLNDWEEETKKAEGNYKTAVTAAANAGRFGKGVSKAGTKKWQEKTLTKGQQRWGPGVAIAEPDYAAGMGPVLDTIRRTDIGPKFPTGDPQNILRVAKIAAALHKLKTG